MPLKPLSNADIAVYVVRHGETTLNAENRFRGGANPPLNSNGIKQAHILESLFAPIELAGIFCSDKQRAVKTAQIIAGDKACHIHQSTALHALNVGDFSGEKRTPEAEAELETYLNDPDSEIPGGESLNEFKARILPCLQEAIHIYEQTGVPPLLVAHSSVIHEIGTIVHGDHKAILVEPGGVIAIYFANGRMNAEPIFKKINAAPGIGASTIT